MPNVEIDALPTSQAIGWADAPISRNAADKFSFGNSGYEFVGPNNARITVNPAGNGIVRFSGGSTSEASMQVARAGVVLDEDTALQWSGDSLRVDQGIGSTGVGLHKDAASTLAQRNGTNPQAFNIYNTYTDASNYERGFIRWSSNVLEIGHSKAGTGGDRSIAIGADRTSAVLIQRFGGTVLSVGSSVECFANLSPGPSATYSLGTPSWPWKDIFLRPSSSLTPSSNGDLCIESTSNDWLTMKLKGSDGTVRSSRLLMLDGVTDDVMELRRGTSAQAFRIYNTYTDASNYERGVMRWSSNVLEIGSESAGTGVNRVVRIGGSSNLNLRAFGSDLLQLGTSSLTPLTGGAVSLGFASLPYKDIFLRPSASLTPSANGDLCIEATNNTTLTFKLKGSDGTVRSGTVALS